MAKQSQYQRKVITLERRLRSDRMANAYGRVISPRAKLAAEDRLQTTDVIQYENSSIPMKTIL